MVGTQLGPSAALLSTSLPRSAQLTLCMCYSMCVCSARALTFDPTRSWKTMTMAVLWTGGEWAWSCMR